MKKVLILASSPRKGGNSDLLCEQFMQGAHGAGHEVETVYLRDRKIGHCLGCEHCRQHDGECILNDDMAGILDSMIAADVIVLATPVYFYTMNGQLKTLIDRTVAKYTEIRGKDFYFIVSAADGDEKMMARTIEEFRGFLYCLDEVEEQGVVLGVGAWKKGDIVGSRAMSHAHALGSGI